MKLFLLQLLPSLFILMFCARDVMVQSNCVVPTEDCNDKLSSIITHNINLQVLQIECGEDYVRAALYETCTAFGYNACQRAADVLYNIPHNCVNLGNFLYRVSEKVLQKQLKDNPINNPYHLLD